MITNDCCSVGMGTSFRRLSNMFSVTKYEVKVESLKIDKLMKRVGNFKEKIIVTVGVPIYVYLFAGRCNDEKASLSQWDARAQYSSLMSYESTHYMDRAARKYIFPMFTRDYIGG